MKNWISSRVLVLAIVVFAVSFAQTVWAGLDQTSVPLRTQVSTELFDHWQYVAYREGSQITLEVRLKDTNPTGLDAFRMASHQMAEDLIRTQDAISANVVLASPMPTEEFIRLVAQYKLQVSAFQMRAIDGRGARVTLFLNPSQNELISMTTVDSLLAWARSETGDAKLLGVTSFETYIPSAQFNEVAVSSHAYLIDVTQTVARQHFQQNHATLIKEGDIIVVPAYPVYWYLEDSRQNKN